MICFIWREHCSDFQMVNIQNVKSHRGPRKSLGFKESLFLLPFDHRSSFERGILGINGRSETAQERAKISYYKEIIYEGFLRAISLGIPKTNAGVLVDEKYGVKILSDAKAFGCWVACCVEKSGLDEFDFEYGDNFKEHILNIHPDFVKVLVRYNPEGDIQLNQRQTLRLKLVSDFCHENNFLFMFELLVPATKTQLRNIDNNLERYDQELRPDLMVFAIKHLQEDGVEPDIWKVEGVQTKSEYEKIAAQALRNGRNDVALIVLGHGKNKESVKNWLSVAAQVPAFCGFAVGRTVWEESLKKHKSGQLSAKEASIQISERFKIFYDFWITAKKHIGNTDDN